MIAVDYHPAAYAELVEATDWYDEQREALGTSFETDVYRAIDTIAENPSAWQRWLDLPEVRIFPLDRFPFLIP